MEKCISDLALSADTIRAFQSEADVVSLPIPSFTARILTQGFWPSSTVGSQRGSGSAMQGAGVGDDVFLPPIMRQCRDTFEAWYVKTFQGRRLAWPHALGTVEVRATLPASKGSKTYDVNLATLQAVVLLAFNDLTAQSGGALVSLRTLAERVHLNISDLKPLVHSLACGNYKLLTKTPPGKHISDGDQFAANPQFSCPKRVFALSMPSVERAHNPERMHENRNFVIDAAVVRIMKGRRQMTHHELVAETIAHIRLFKAQPVDVKKRIHSLIDTEYLERSGQSTYRYLA
jgi:cullin 1